MNDTARHFYDKAMEYERRGFIHLARVARAVAERLAVGWPVK